MRLELIPAKTVIDPDESVVFSASVLQTFDPIRIVVDGYQSVLDLIPQNRSPALVTAIHFGVRSQLDTDVDGVPVEAFESTSDYGSSIFDRCERGQDVSVCVKNVCHRPVVLRVWLEGHAVHVGE